LPALPYPSYSIENLYLFPVYHSQDEYQRGIGQAAPAWDAKRLPKFWFDPKAKDSTKRNVVYDSVLALDVNGKEMTDANGKIMLDVLMLTKQEASTVNIPPPFGNVPGATAPPVPCPMRPLASNEEIYYQFGGVLAVKNTDLFDNAQSGFAASDRALLQSIATKLGL